MNAAEQMMYEQQFARRANRKAKLMAKLAALPGVTPEIIAQTDARDWQDGILVLAIQGAIEAGDLDRLGRL